MYALVVCTMSDFRTIPALRHVFILQACRWLSSVSMVIDTVPCVGLIRGTRSWKVDVKSFTNASGIQIDVAAIRSGTIFATATSLLLNRLLESQPLPIRSHHHLKQVTWLALQLNHADGYSEAGANTTSEAAEKEDA